MTINKILAINEGKTTEGIREFLRDLLVQKHLDALLVLLDKGSPGSPAMTLVSDPVLLQYAKPLAPVMPRNAAQIISRMTRVAASKQKIGVVLRPCEIRALIELVKLKQASLDNLTVIGIDCPGTCSVADYKQLSDNSLTQELPLRQACQVCEFPSPDNTDIAVGLFGMDASRGILIQGSTQNGEKLLTYSGLQPVAEDDIKKRQQALADVKAKRIENRDKFFTRLNSEITGTDKLLTTIAACTACHNCRVMCPICYCRECFFDSPTFEFEADNYLGWAERKGAMKMPADSLLFHLTRLNHMVTSCVGCGMCSEACPNNVPVFDIFRLVGARVQSEFSYIPGRSLDESPPLTVFKEDELKEIG